jgi:hypothetical protein
LQPRQLEHPLLVEPMQFRQPPIPEISQAEGPDG